MILDLPASPLATLRRLLPPQTQVAVRGLVKGTDIVEEDLENRPDIVASCWEAWSASSLEVRGYHGTRLVDPASVINRGLLPLDPNPMFARLRALLTRWPLGPRLQPGRADEVERAVRAHWRVEGKLRKDTRAAYLFLDHRALDRRGFTDPRRAPEFWEDLVRAAAEVCEIDIDGALVAGTEPYIVVARVPFRALDVNHQMGLVSEVVTHATWLARGEQRLSTYCLVAEGGVGPQYIDEVRASPASVDPPYEPPPRDPEVEAILEQMFSWMPRPGEFPNPKDWDS